MGKFAARTGLYYCRANEWTQDGVVCANICCEGRCENTEAPTPLVSGQYMTFYYYRREINQLAEEACFFLIRFGDAKFRPEIWEELFLVVK